ncbi:MAG: hypothetical protein MJZ81_09870 [Bacteroidales bacterium]|nr:hypothetical protein [Bacteroidales bacterium]
MKYNISKSSSPKMPVLGKGTECLKLLLSQASKERNQPLVPMLFFHFGAHLKETEFLYPDQSWKEPCGMMANLVAGNNGNGGLSPDRKKKPSVAAFGRLGAELATVRPIGR